MSFKIGLLLYYVTRVFGTLSARFWTFVIGAYLKEKSANCGSVAAYGYSRFIHVGGLTIGMNNHINFGAYWLCEGGLTIGDNCHFGKNCTIYTRNHNHKGAAIPYDDTNINRPVNIGDNVWIGTNVTILPGATIGEGAIIGAGSVVHGTIPPFAIMGAPGPTQLGERDREHYAAMLEARQFGGAGGKVVTYPKKDVAR